MDSRRDITSNLHEMSDDTRDYCDVDDCLQKNNCVFGLSVDHSTIGCNSLFFL